MFVEGTGTMGNNLTRESIEVLFRNFAAFLAKKNERYGDSALHPIKVFSDIPAEAQICNRLDDKLSRIKVSDELRRNDVADVFGYIALLRVQKGWLEFDDLLD